MNTNILVVDDDETVRMSIDFFLGELGYQVFEASSPEQALILLKQEDIDLLLVDMNYRKDTTSGAEGLAFLSTLKHTYPQLPAVALTAWADVQLVVKAIKAGASDFIEKPWDNNRLQQIISQQLKISKLENKNRRMQHQQKITQQNIELVYQSSLMHQLMEKIERIAVSDMPVLLTGENGTGKSSLALKIHQLSERHNEAFIDVNMGAIPGELFESEMFGHQKGAYTGAAETRIGRFEMADQGSLFLDEIATLTLTQQAKLLRVLESGNYEPVGSSKTRKADVRIISASNGDFEQLVKDKHFRQDLYYRLNPLELHVPSLRERPEDIYPLAEHFLAIFGRKYRRETLKLSASAIKALERYRWPGNVRELSHVMGRAALLSPTSQIGISELQLSSTDNTDHISHDQIMTLEQSEKNLIINAMKASNGKTQDAAELLGITAGALYRRLDKFQINGKK